MDGVHVGWSGSTLSVGIIPNVSHYFRVWDPLRGINLYTILTVTEAQSILNA